MTADTKHGGTRHSVFPCTERGHFSHELVILPLPDNHIPGTRPDGGDAKIDEPEASGKRPTPAPTAPVKGICRRVGLGHHHVAARAL